jgi:APA family basic amino acid/polyamine antiporter
MLGQLLGKAGVSTMAAVIMCSTLGAINSTILQTPRIAFAMGRDRVFFQTLGKVHAEYRTPAPAILVLALMSIGLIAAVAIGQWVARDADPASYPGALLQKVVASLKDNSIFGLLTNFVIFSASIFYTLGVLAVVVLRIRQPKTERPYRTLGYPLTPLVFIAVYVWFLYQVYWSNPLEAHTGLVAIAAGLPFYFGYRWWVGRSKVPSTKY